MMNEIESSKIFRALSEHVHEQRLDWVLEQVSEQIRFGAEEKKSVRVDPDEVLRVAAMEQSESRPRRSKVLFAATRPYTEREQLLLLIDALQTAVVGTTEMEVGFKDALQTLELLRSGVLVREELNPKLTRIDDSADEITGVRRRGEAERLSRLLKELREEV
jgi:hypothetical protein